MFAHCPFNALSKTLCTDCEIKLYNSSKTILNGFVCDLAEC